MRTVPEVTTCIFRIKQFNARWGHSTAYDEMTGHGFRSAASSILNACGEWTADAIERQLAHVDSDSVRRAYARADYSDERVSMMAWWADRSAEMNRGGVVIPLRA